MTTPNGKVHVVQQVQIRFYERKSTGERQYKIMLGDRVLSSGSLEPPHMMQAHLRAIREWIDWEVKQ